MNWFVPASRILLQYTILPQFGPPETSNYSCLLWCPSALVELCDANGLGGDSNIGFRAPHQRNQTDMIQKSSQQTKTSTIIQPKKSAPQLVLVYLTHTNQPTSSLGASKWRHPSPCVAPNVAPCWSTRAAAPRSPPPRCGSCGSRRRA